ncbi:MULTISPECIES: PepSY-associated TM helix domain-containing protein [Pseudomonadaceae]|uniref:PepSY-associated TM helix domain-containing protein n=1 Tax=Pseudomonadaceae TaxID=135621 RepID=UPI0015E2A325|nr:MULTISPECIES: PepSY-associated TM helix domain-containing protein [Pseudomonadaceae]MBA1277258.1 PepSY domain-containing protein [Stutzerimonas stutzeri]MBC8650729.1 PepSY domain-containing protein [Pseudomonas sp. MT4]QXY91506.1 PepSY domain-containing protein [Pseudomonas sp. MTM4]
MPSSHAQPEAPPLASRTQRPLLALLIRLHLYVGLFVGPFILIAALSGLIYALTPQLESRLYAEQLFVDSGGPSLPLARQIEVAQAHVGEAATLSAVRPAPQSGTTTRVMFSAPELGPSESRAVFIDPVTAEIRGDLLVYGTTGVLPLRTWLDQFHRSLLLGEPGRIYSELAASWLWVAALGGLALWVIRRQGNRKASVARTQRLRRWHATLGLWLVVGLLFFSATGLTWSRWAGDNIGVARAAFGMSTPSVSTALTGEPVAPAGEHAHHAGMQMAAAEPGDPALFDAVLAAARRAGIDAGKLEIVPAAGPDRAWTVTEIDRSWPTQVDAVAIDPRSLAVTDRIDFATFPLAAKLTRWGIDAHMGSLFGLANQLLLAVTALGLVTLVIWGYLMWWRRRSTVRRPGMLHALRDLLPTARVVTVGLAVLFGYCLPVLGGSLVLFLFAEWVLGGIRRTDHETLRQSG